MATHVNNCFHAPLDVKASLCYLTHRSLLQKQELAGQWKFAFLKGVWNRLHQNHSTVESSANEDANDYALLKISNSTASSSSAPAKDPGGSRHASYESTTPTESPMDVERLSEERLIEERVVEENQGLHHDSFGSGVYEEEQHHGSAPDVREMKDLIKAAALWLSERDAEYEARGGHGKTVMKRR